MKAIVVLVILIGAGCTSADGRKYDYRSINDNSLEFLFETHREGVKATRGYLKEDLQFGRRERVNSARRKRSMAFAVDSFFLNEMANFKQMWVDLKEEMRWDGEKIRHSAIFGHLDTGDP